MTCRREFCLNYSVYCPAVTVEDVQLFEAEMAATVETLFLSVTEPLPITPKASSLLVGFVGNSILSNAGIVIMSLFPGEFCDQL